MQFVNDDVAQILESLGPLRVVRQQAGVEHVRVSQHQLGPFANGAAGVLRRVAVVSKGLDIGANGIERGLHLV